MVIDQLFSSTQLNTEGLAKANEISEHFTRLVDELAALIPGKSREIALVFTKLEEASFYAKKALRNYPSNVAK